MSQDKTTKAFAFAHFESFFIVVHTKHRPEDREWNAYLRAVRGVSCPLELKGLVVTLGGAPSDSQRTNWSNALKQAGATEMPYAIMTNHLMARMAIRALQLKKHAIGRFALDDLGGALKFLGEIPVTPQEVHAELAKMCAELGLDTPPLPQSPD